MPTANVNGMNIAYELHGEGEPVALTPGGRFDMDTAGVRELAQTLAAGGKQVLIWDRPNTGRSDVRLDTDFESSMHADTLAGLIETLDLGKTTIIGGSAGSRVSLLTVARHPEIAEKLGIWWISGGFFGLILLANYYCADSWSAAKRHGMEAVVELPMWQETLQKNPANREKMLALDPEEFAARMEAWGAGFLPQADSPVPGMRPEMFAGINVPTLVFRSSATDNAHPRRTSEWVAELIPTARLVEPPFGDNEWNERSDEYGATGVNNLFASWPELAAPLLEFMNEPVPAAV
jgi:pimeloyl-ACP methyl ester carboxylesterase